MVNIAARDVCNLKGHHIQSLEVGRPIGDPVTKTFFYEKELRCIQCGLAAGQVKHSNPAKPRKEVHVGEEAGSPALGS